MEAAAVNQILIKLLLLALNLMPLDQAAFSFHVVQDGYYTATYRVERRDQDFTVFRPLLEAEGFPAFDAERSRRFGRSYTARIHGSGEIISVVLTDIMRDMPPLSLVPRQILRGEAGNIRLDGVGKSLFLAVDGESISLVAEVNAPL
jgi:hypothetical protein